MLATKITKLDILVVRILATNYDMGMFLMWIMMNYKGIICELNVCVWTVNSRIVYGTHTN